MSYKPACVPITKKIANFKVNNDCLEDLAVDKVGGINGVYGKRLEEYGICTAAQLKHKTRCMDACEFERFLAKKACMNRLHSAMAYKTLHGRVNKSSLKKALNKKHRRC